MIKNSDIDWEKELFTPRTAEEFIESLGNASPEELKQMEEKDRIGKLEQQ